jgi:hypothetical protein
VHPLDGADGWPARGRSRTRQGIPPPRGHRPRVFGVSNFGRKEFEEAHRHALAGSSAKRRERGRADRDELVHAERSWDCRHSVMRNLKGHGFSLEKFFNFFNSLLKLSAFVVMFSDAATSL